MKRLIIVLTTILACAFLSACAPKSEYVSVEGDERKAVITSVDPLAQDILDGIQKNDYSLFSKDFDEQMQKALTQDQFPRLMKSIGSQGAVVSSEITAVETLDKYYRVIYKVTFEKSIVLMTIVVSKDDTTKISGLWFK